MKISPNKYTNTDLSVIGLSIAIVASLKKTQSNKYDALLNKVVNKRGELAKKNYLLALVFLYSIGKLHYDQKTDMVILN